MKGVASDDLGMDSGPFMHTESYRALFKPRHAQLCDYVHKHSRGILGTPHLILTAIKCGVPRIPLIPDLIDAGYDVINPDSGDTTLNSDCN